MSLEDDDYYDRTGNIINFQRWGLLFHDARYQVLRQTKVGKITISTIWLGIDHSFGGGEPMIFETAVLGPGGPRRYGDMYRYPTEDGALEHHEELVAQARLIESAR